MKRNTFMFISGLLMIIGSTVVVPLIGVGASIFLGDDFTGEIPNSNQEALPLIAVVAIGVAILIPIIGMLLIFGAFLIPFISNARANSRIISQGQPAEAKILALADTGARINDNPLVSFSLVVRSPTQPPFRAEVRHTVSIIHLPSYQPGKILHVKYLPGTDKVAIIGAKMN